MVGASRFGVPPQVNVMGTIIFVVGVALALGSVALQRRSYRPAPVAAEELTPRIPAQAGGWADDVTEDLVIAWAQQIADWEA